MKIKTTRIISLLITIIYTMALMPALAIAADSLILGGDFEKEDYSDLWIGATRDALCAYEGDWGINVFNPYGDDSMGHILEYADSVHLEEGMFYTFYAQVMNPMATHVSTPEASAYIGRGGDELFIDISSVGENWCEVSASFMATEDTDPSLTITFTGNNMDVGVFVDSVRIVREDRTPEYTVLNGPESIFIPENGYADYRYTLTAYDAQGMPINILIPSLKITADNLPEGMELDEPSGKLRVFPDAPANCTFTLTCLSSFGENLTESSRTVITTKNLLSDPSFEEGEELWYSDDDIAYNGGAIELFADTDGEWGKCATINYSKQLLLHSGQMYVFRADVRSDEEFESSSVYISNLSFAFSGYAEINITGIGGEWSQVTSAFVIEDTGLYDLTINLYAPSSRPIMLDNVFLGVENVAPTSISIRAPGNIQIPPEVTVLPCYANVLNQLGEVMDEYEPTVTISPQNSGVYLDNGEIIVTCDAKADDYTVTANYGTIESKLVITVSDDAIGDGGFEVRQANEWWTASDGSIFSIIDYDGDKSGHVYSPDSSCLVINNSYMTLEKDEYYVFSAAAGYGNANVTAFIADTYSGEYVPFAVYDPEEDVKIPFSPDETLLGRLVLYFESDENVGVIFDDISIVPAELGAYEIIVSGGEYGDFLRGSYSYINNMTDSADADISATRWYISSEYDGHYEPIGIPNQDYLEFTEDMVGQYIVYEVTPICAYTGLVGDSLRSLPVQIAADVADNPGTDIPLADLSPIELEATSEHPFRDITAHWCEDMIASLYQAGIIAGREEGRFVPDYYVTRAEAATMIARAFSLVSLPYSGHFDDVSSSDWYSGWIESCYRRGIITGVDENTFAPNERITREEMATMIYRAYLLADGPLPYDMELRYYDSFMISPWAYESVKNCTNLNILTGTEASLFKPQSHATRAEAAAALYRALKSF